MRKIQISGSMRRPVPTECTVGILPDNGRDRAPYDKGRTASMHGE
jgi:hypothetical protein